MSNTPAPQRMASDIDHLLRGRFTTPELLRSGRIDLPLRTLGLASLGMGALYGGAMGLFAVTARDGGEGWMQVLSSALKVPLLFLLTLGVTFPSLYVVSALARSRLRAADTLRLLLAAVTVNLALLASLGPVAAFFTLSTDSYPFMKLLHVTFFAAAGLVGVGFLRRALASILETDEQPAAESVPQEGQPPLRSPVRTSNTMRTVFRVWIVVFGVVGAQMGWILRPFIGAPQLEFVWFRERDSHILAALLSTLVDLFQ